MYLLYTSTAATVIYGFLTSGLYLPLAVFSSSCSMLFIDTARWVLGPQQQTCGRTDGRTPDSCINPRPHTMRAEPLTNF